MRISLYVLQVTLLLFIADISFGQIIWHDGIQVAMPQFSLYTNATTSIGARTVGSGASVSISLGSSVTSLGLLVNGPAPVGAHVTNGWSTSSTGYGSSRYIQFTINALSGTNLTIGSFRFRAGRNNNGPRDYSFRTGSGSGVWTTEHGSADNIPYSLSNPAEYTINISPAIAISSNSSRSFRLYLKDAQSINDVFYLHDFTFNAAKKPLPVDFGDIVAIQKKEVLTVRWSTLKETNNAYFDVQASKDGNVFKTIKTVASKNGNSDIAQDYEVHITDSNMDFLLGVPALLGLLCLSASRKKRIVFCIAALIISATNFIGCNKQGNIMDIEEDFEKTFIRIAQIDIDGTRSYSKTVQVVDVKR